MMSGTSAAAGGPSGATACAPATAGGASAAAASGFFVTTAFLAGALRFFVFAACLPAAFIFGVLAAFVRADLDFPVRAAFFFAGLRFVGMGIPPRWAMYGVALITLICGAFKLHTEEKANRRSRHSENPSLNLGSLALMRFKLKVYNARAILEDYWEIGPAVWSRFNRGREKQLWYFGELSKVYEERGSNRLTQELERVVSELARLSAGES
jgi:hypothetical protein